MPEAMRSAQASRQAAGAAGAFVLACALAGCSGVVSATPWFTQADSAGAPQFRPGVWKIDASPPNSCAVDETKPLRDWPACAAGVVVRGATLMAPSRGGRAVTWEKAPYVLAAGDPLILQYEDTSESPPYDYVWVSVTRRDDQGRAVAMQGWRVLCGPPPAASGAASPPYPGLVAQDSNCTADSAASLRAAASATRRDYPDDIFGAHWVREGDR